MKEKISWKGEQKRNQPRIRGVRLRDLYLMKEFTKRPMTVLLDEALSVYLSSFIASSEFTAWAEHIEREIDERRNQEPNTDDYEDMSSYYDL